MKLSLKLLILSGFLFFGLNASAQSVAAAGAKFNAANKQFTAKAYGQAVKLYEDALNICNAAGPDAFTLRGKIEKQLAKSYFWNGISYYKQRQFDKAVGQMHKAKQLAEKIGDTKIKSLAITYAARVYSSKGMSMMKNKDYKGAAAQFDAAIKEKPDCLNAYYGKTLLGKETKNIDGLIASVNKLGQLIKTNRNPKGPKMYATAKRVAFGTLLNEGALELQKEHPKDALASLEKSIQFNASNGMVYYYISIANLKLKKWNESISNAQKALNLPGTNKANVYFTLGQAYQGKGETTHACNAFKHVTSGPNVAAAKYQIKQVLKCK